MTTVWLLIFLAPTMTCLFAFNATADASIICSSGSGVSVAGSITNHIADHIKHNNLDKIRVRYQDSRAFAFDFSEVHGLVVDSYETRSMENVYIHRGDASTFKQSRFTFADTQEKWFLDAIKSLIEKDDVQKLALYLSGSPETMASIEKCIKKIRKEHLVKSIRVIREDFG
jgi:hypothetical protein